MKLPATIFLAPLLLLNTAAFSQAKKDTLLWFVGKWQSKTVFKADSNYLSGGAKGSTVTVNADGTTYTQSTEGKALNKTIDDGITASDGMDDKIKQQLENTGGISQYNLYTYTKEELDSAKAFVQSAEVPTSPPQPAPPGGNNQTSFYNAVARACQTTGKSDYNQVIDFWQAHKALQGEHIDYPPPPEADYFNCWGCNRDAQKEFDKKCELYDSAFFQPEAGLIRIALNIMRQLSLLGFGENPTYITNDMQTEIDNLFHHDNRNPAANGPCAYLDYGQLSQAFEFLVSRCEKKAGQLFDDVKNHKKYNSFRPAIHELLMAKRAAIMALGGNSGDDDHALNDCKGLTKALLDTLVYELADQHDYSYLPDVPFLLSLTRQYLLLAGNSADEDNYINKILSALDFTLSMDMNVKTKLGNGFMATHLKGDAKVTVELDSVRCVLFVLEKSENGKMTFNVLQNEMSGSNCAATYTGTKTYVMAPPGLNIHFCKAVDDTLTLARLAAQPPTGGTWQFCDGHTSPTGIGGADSYFNDVNAMVRQARAVQGNAANNQQMQDLAAKAMAQANALKQQNASGAGASDPQAMMKGFKNMMDIANTVTNTQEALLARTIIPVTVHNKQPVLIDQTLDAKVINTRPDINNMIVYGTLKIQLKHTPASAGNF